MICRDCDAKRHQSLEPVEAITKSFNVSLNSWYFLRLNHYMIRLMRLFIVVGILMIAVGLKAQTSVSGTVLVDTHWTTSGSPYNLVGVFGVNTGATLTID